MKIRTVDELDERIRDDLTWRKHELKFFDQQIHAAGPIAKRSLLRASVPLLYAHWEGFVKTACHYYLCYVASLRLSTEKLTPEIAALSLRSTITGAVDAKRSMLQTKMVVEIREGSGQRARVPTRQDAIRTASNLSFSVLEDVLHSVGLGATPYEYARDLIDVQLVAARNKIAHGEQEYIHQPEWTELQVEVTKMMDAIAVQVVNASLSKAYFAIAFRP